MNPKQQLSVVVPCFNEALCVEAFVRAVEGAGVEGVEFVFVDDGSTDETLAVIKRLAAADGASATSPFRATSGRRPPSSRVCARPRATLW